LAGPLFLKLLQLIFLPINKFFEIVRTFVVGDIHGGLKALKIVLEKAAVTKEDTLIFLGDYVDGWNESAQVISFLIDLHNEQKCIFIKGNHDVWCEDWLRTGKADPKWLIHGGQATIESYAAITEVEKRMHLHFLQRMKLFFVDTKNRLFIHAGFTSMNGPEQEFYDSNFIWDRTLWEMALAVDKTLNIDSAFYPKRLKLYKEIFIGHTPTTNYNQPQPMHAGNVQNIDTGAGFLGKLTIMDIHSYEFWQSDSLPNLYPYEKGRNK
jgi:serine/threonine protein phosphatase 1